MQTKFHLAHYAQQHPVHALEGREGGREEGGCIWFSLHVHQQQLAHLVVVRRQGNVNSCVTCIIIVSACIILYQLEV